MKTLTIGDIHGGYVSLKQCLRRSDFNYEEDKLIVLGDIVDGWSESMEVIQELMKIENLVYVIGNHDQWFIDYLKTGDKPNIWLIQGGQETLDSYDKKLLSKEELLEFFDKGVYYHIDDDNRIYVHGGFDWKKDISEQDPYELYWDRHLYETVRLWHNQGTILKVKAYTEVFIGHTSTSGDDSSLKPQFLSNIINIDQGGGWKGKLTIMNVNTKEYWQSDLVEQLYYEEALERQK